MYEVAEEPAGPLATIAVGDRAYSLAFPSLPGDDTPIKIAGTQRPLDGDLLEAMAASLGPDDLAVDVGAGFGNHAIYLAAIAGCEVLAYEPDTVQAAVLRANVARNGLTQRVVVRESATLVLDERELPTRVSALRIGVTGTELDVLSSASALIERDRPAVFVECGDLSDITEICDHATDLGYLLVGTYGETPTLAFDVPQRIRAEAVANSLLISTQSRYALGAGNQAMRAELADRASEYERATNEYEQRYESARGRLERLELALFRAHTDAREARLESRQARASFTQADAELHVATERLAQTERRLRKARRSLRQAEAERDALSKRRIVRFANRLGRASRHLKPSGPENGSDRRPPT